MKTGAELEETQVSYPLLFAVVAAIAALSGCGEAPGADRAASVRADLVDLSTCGPTNLALNTTGTGLPSPLESDAGVPGAGGGVWDLLDGETEYDTAERGLVFDAGGMHQVTVDLGRLVSFDRVTVWHRADNGDPGQGIPGDVTLEYYDGVEWLPIGAATRTVKLPVCGDGVRLYPEECDDANVSNADACLASCVAARCGDGFVQVGVEACDDANGDPDDGCGLSPAVCAVQNPEASAGGTCLCQGSSCGNGEREDPEECDDGNNVDTDTCTNVCAAARCGDGIVQPVGANGLAGDGDDEDCDDGNAIDDDVCGDDCVLNILEFRIEAGADELLLAAAGPPFVSYSDAYSFAPVTGTMVRWSYDGDGPNFGAVVGVEAGLTHACALDASGAVYCWGTNDFGQLGNGTFESSFVPLRVPGLGDAVGVAAGEEHSCALRAGGDVACWGSTFDGVEWQTVALPAAVSGLDDATAVAGGAYHTCALRENGEVACWGWNGSGQLGDGSTADAVSPVAVPGLTDAVAIAAGFAHTCAARATGEVACWGYSGEGQLGDGVTREDGFSSVPVLVAGLSDAAGIASGEFHACALRTTGEIACWGSGQAGQLGDGSVGEEGLGASSTVPVPVAGLTDSVQVAAGTYHTCAVRQTGEMACWGNNGALGNGTFAGSPAPVPVSELDDAVRAAAGAAFTCVLRSGGRLACWGTGERGELGTAFGSSEPVAVSGLSDAVQVGTGSSHSCAVLGTGEVACWGSGSFGELGTGTMTANSSKPTAVAGIGDAVAMATMGGGASHSCVVRETGEVACWGYGQYGQLGDGVLYTDPLGAVDPVMVAGLADAVGVSAGGAHTCAVRADGRVACWGYGFNGQLGDGNAVSSATPVLVVGLSDAVGVSASTDHSCALRATGEVACWGEGQSGRLGNGTDTSSSVPVPVLGLSDALSIRGGFEHTCALRATGEVACWGSGGNGQLGDGALHTDPPYGSLSPVPVVGIGDGIALAAGGYHGCALRATGEIVCWGYGGDGELGNGAVGDSNVPVAVQDLTDAVGVSAGYGHSCAARSTGEVACWGNGGSGQLGNGAAAYSAVPQPVSSFDDAWHAWIHEISVQGCAEAPPPESASDTVPAAGSLTTDAEGDGATPADPVETSVTTPNAGPVSIEEAPFEAGPPAGFTFFGQQVTISAPNASTANPLVLTFVIDGTLLPAGTDETDVEIFRNGILVGACALPAPPRAIPNPCIFSRARAGDDVVITVATSAASVWSFGIADASDRDGDGTPDGYDGCPSTPAGHAVDASGCSIAQLCPCAGPAGSGRRWRNHGRYVACVADAAQAFQRASLIDRSELRQIVRKAERARCGRDRPLRPRHR